MAAVQAQVGQRITHLLWNAGEARLRAGWRVLIYTALWVFAPALLSILIGARSAHVLTEALPVTQALAMEIILLLLKLVVQLGGIWLVVYLFDRRSLADLGLHLNRQWWLDLGFGLALGAGLMALIFVVEWLAGWVQVIELWHDALPDTPFMLALIGPLIVFTVVSLTEELLARGYYIRNLAEGLVVRPLGAKGAVLAAWIVSSLLFGLVPARNPNATWISTSALMLAGLFLGLGYILTGSLALPIGLHLTWNFFQGSIFGFPVSGIAFNVATLITIKQQGPVIWTGGAFGPEAGLLGILAILVGGGLILWWVQYSYGEVRLVTALACYPDNNQAVAQKLQQREIEVSST